MQVITIAVPGTPGPPGDLMPAATVNPVSATPTILLSQLPSTLTWVLAANTTLSALPTPAAGKSGTVTLVIKQAATGGPYTFTWPATLEWAEDSLAPAMPTVANSELIVHLLWTGTAWRAAVQGNYYP